MDYYWYPSGRKFYKAKKYINTVELSKEKNYSETSRMQCCVSGSVPTGSVFRSFLDPDQYSEYGSGSTHAKHCKYRLKWRQKMYP